MLLNVFITCRINTRKIGGVKPLVARPQTVSKCKFNFTSDAHIEQLKLIKLKKKTESKVNWAVSAYNEWRNDRLENFKYDYPIYNADLMNLDNLDPEDLQHSLCRFVPEVTKKKGDGLYPGRTLYEMIVSIQKYLNVNKIKWKLIEGEQFQELRVVLDNVMKERAQANVGLVPKQAEIISYEDEEKLWIKGLLGEENPDQLRSTILFLLGINMCFRAVEDHYNLRRPLPNQPSQLTFEHNKRGIKCLVYREDTCSKTHDGGLSDMNSDRKEVWVYPRNNVNCCPIRLVQKYLSLCPRYVRKNNFYLQSFQKPTPTQWYAEQVVGQNTLSKVIKTIMSEAGIEGFYTNHSARRTGSTRLFRAGAQHKLVNQCTGHRSDAIDKYQITSDAQRRQMSEIMAEDISNNVKELVVIDNDSKVDDKVVENVPKVSNVTITRNESDAIHANPNLDSNSVGNLVTKLLEGVKKQGKSTIKIQIEIHNE